MLKILFFLHYTLMFSEEAPATTDISEHLGKPEKCSQIKEGLCKYIQGTLNYTRDFNLSTEAAEIVIVLDEDESCMANVAPVGIDVRACDFHHAPDIHIDLDENRVSIHRGTPVSGTAIAEVIIYCISATANVNTEVEPFDNSTYYRVELD